MVWSQDWLGILEYEPITSVGRVCGLLWEELKSWRTHRGRRLFSWNHIRHGSRLSASRGSAAKRYAAIRLLSPGATPPRRVATSPPSPAPSSCTPAPTPRPERFRTFPNVSERFR